MLASVMVTVHPGSTVMIRINASPLVFFLGVWCTVLAAQPASETSSHAQMAPVARIAPVHIHELGLAEHVRSAIDLVGPQSSSAGALRAVLVERLQCWIDGVADCVQADINDPRVRAYRRHLAFGDYPQDGTVSVRFPDGSRIDLGIARSAPGPAGAWRGRAYVATVQVDTAQAPGVPVIPMQLRALNELADEVMPDVASALHRLRARLAAAVDASHAQPRSEVNIGEMEIVELQIGEMQIGEIQIADQALVKDHP